MPSAPPNSATILQAVDYGIKLVFADTPISNGHYGQSDTYQADFRTSLATLTGRKSA
ncbi:MAG: hypothetical protein ACPID2_03020 [Candidatus Puniceispirillum sp.]